MNNENSWPWVLEQPKRETKEELEQQFFDGLKGVSDMIDTDMEEFRVAWEKQMHTLGKAVAYPSVEVKGVRACRVPWLKETGENRDGEE